MTVFSEHSFTFSTSPWCWSQQPRFVTLQQVPEVKYLLDKAALLFLTSGALFPDLPIPPTPGIAGFGKLCFCLCFLFAALWFCKPRSYLSPLKIKVWHSYCSLLQKQLLLQDEEFHFQHEMLLSVAAQLLCAFHEHCVQFWSPQPKTWAHSGFTQQKNDSVCFIIQHFSLDFLAATSLWTECIQSSF